MPPSPAALALLLLGLAGPARAAAVWAIDDGERIERDATTPPPWKGGLENPVWQPGKAIRLLALRDEVVAFQVVVEADAGAPLEGVTVEISGLPGIGVERFVEHFFEVRRSSTDGKNHSLGWAPGSGPPAKRHTGWLPDALIPVEIAPGWAPYPLRVAPRQNGVVWIDLTVPRDLAPGTLEGRVEVRAGGRALATLPLELEVLPATLPARPVATMLFYDRGTLRRRIGGGPAVEHQLWTLLHRHRLTPLHDVNSVDDLRAHLPALDGSHYATGPAAGVADDILVLGVYGTLGDPTPARLATVEEIAREVAARGLFSTAAVVLYAEDEVCESSRGAGWRALIAGSLDASARRIRVGWTCSEEPAGQPVDVPMVVANAYDPLLARRARAAGKETWIYGGWRPATGTVLTDTEAVSLRTLGWIAAMANIPRWFLWETTFWDDGNRGGRGPYDPFASAETFHNQDGEASMGDGVLLYPGQQLERFTEHSLGFPGVLPSIRLKNLRRGIQDAGYLQLARGADPAEAERIARALLPRILAEAAPGQPPSWGERGQPFFEARRRLAQLIAVGADPGPSRELGDGTGAAAPRRWRFPLALPLLLLIGVAAARLRSRDQAC